MTDHNNPLIKRGALRQYRHNDGDGFVFGYDMDTTDVYLVELLEELNACALEIAILKSIIRRGPHTLFIATGYGDGYAEILGVFPTRELAEEYIRDLPPHRDGIQITEHNLITEVEPV